MAEKDWVGNKNSISKTLGASNHTENERQIDDFYATEPKAIDILFEVEKFDGGIWECACGQGHLSERMKDLGCDVVSTDLVDRGYGEGGVDFLKCDKVYARNIVTNPPYRYSKDFVEKAMELLEDGGKLALFLKVQFLEGKARKKMFMKYPPFKIYVSSSRLLCAKNARFEDMIKGGGSAVAYAWFVWVKGYNGDTTIDWIN